MNRLKLEERENFISNLAIHSSFTHTYEFMFYTQPQDNMHITWRRMKEKEQKKGQSLSSYLISKCGLFC